MSGRGTAIFVGARSPTIPANNLPSQKPAPTGILWLYHVRSIAHNTIAGAGFGDCPLGANIMGSRAPTGIRVIDRT
jgi:hypothetical protein